MNSIKMCEYFTSISLKSDLDISIQIKMQKDPEKRYYCYFIISGNKTYNGYTVDLKRRLRQHNGLIKVK